MRNFLILHERPLAGAVKILLISLVLVRLGIAYPDRPPVDTQYFVETARLVLNGLSPYRSETNTTIYKHPLQVPSMSLMHMPFCFVPEPVHRIFFFVCGIAMFWGFILLVFNYYGYCPRKLFQNRWSNLPAWIAMFMISTSSPFVLMLRHGQNSCAAALLLFAALFYPARDRSWNILLLGLSASMKYSLLTLQAPVLLIRKRWRLGILAFGLFAGLVLSVGLFLDGAYPTIRDYVLLVVRDITHGANSYTNPNSFQFVHTGFFRCGAINWLCKGLMLTLYASALIRIARRNGKGEADDGRLTAMEWCAFTTATMAITYHRTYDCVLFMPFVGVLFADAWNARRRGRLLGILGISVLLIFWMLPMGVVLSWEKLIARAFPAGGKIFFYARSGTPYAMFPLYQLITLLSTLLLLLAALRQPEAKSKKAVR
jgi:hypothetical protein